MNSDPTFRLQRDRPVPRWGLLALALLIIFGVLTYALISKSPEVTLTAREDRSSAEERAFIVDVRARPPAFRLDLPRLAVHARLREGRGQFWIRAEELPGANVPVKYVLREPWYRSDRKGTVLIARPVAAQGASPVSPEAPAQEQRPAPEHPAPATAPPIQPSPASPPLPPSPGAPEEAPPEPGTAVVPDEAPPAELPAPTIRPRSAWVRDRALEAELAGRGVTGVTITRKGRSIRLRGTVASDKALRTVYQFMNDKGFGEVSYGVEVR